MSYENDYFEHKFSQLDPWDYETSRYERAKYQRQLVLAQKFCATPRRVLEIGCAEGVFTALLEKTYPIAKIIAIDISASAITRAKSKTKTVTYRHGDILKKSDLLKGQYDLIFLSEVVYYLGARVPLPEFADIIKRLRSSLTKNGLLVLSNNIDVTEFNPTYIVEKPVVEGYLATMGGYLQKRWSRKYSANKRETGQQLSYQISVFSR